VRFAGGVTAPLPSEGDMRARISEAYRLTEARLGGSPALILAYPPLLNGQAGDDYVSILTELSGGAPVFGSVCTDEQIGLYANARTLYCAEAYQDRMSFLLIAGDVRPQFHIVSVSSESVLPYRGEITASDGPVLMGVNDMSVCDYLETIGLAEGGKIRNGINSIPFLISFGRETDAGAAYVARALFLVTPENYIVCGGHMPVGASIAVGICDKGDILRTTRELLRRVAADYPGRTVLMHSCLGRRLALGVDPLLEAEMTVEEMPPASSFMLSYSSGELCPIAVGDQGAVNRFHNYTLIVCVL
jgi:hypothetical protein